jgi:hypothetical protein
VQSTPEEGSCFTLAIKVTPLEDPEDQKPEMGLTAFHGQTVLLAAKNPTTCRVLGRSLAAFGFTVTCHNNWARAQAELTGDHTQQPYFLAVIDMELIAVDFADTPGSAGACQPVCPVVGFGFRNERGLVNPPPWVVWIVAKPVKQSALLAAIMAAAISPAGQATENLPDHLARKSGEQPPAPGDTMTDRQVEETLVMAATLKNLLEQNSLKAKDYSRQFSRHLAGSAIEPEARMLEEQIRRFDFEKAKQTFASLYARVVSVQSKRRMVNEQHRETGKS